jgi:hypothetical protein
VTIYNNTISFSSPTPLIKTTHIPPNPPLGQMIHRRKPARKMIRLLIRRRNRNPKPNILRGGRHRRDDRERLIHRPLRTRRNGRIQVPGSLVHVVAAEDVGDEDAVELCALEELRQLDPVVYVVEAVRLVFRVGPEAWGLVAAACLVVGLVLDICGRRRSWVGRRARTHLDEGVEDERLARSVGGRLVGHDDCDCFFVK